MIACLYISIAAAIICIFCDVTWIVVVMIIVWLITEMVAHLLWRRTCERIETLENTVMDLESEKWRMDDQLTVLESEVTMLRFGGER